MMSPVVSAVTGKAAVIVKTASVVILADSNPLPNVNPVAPPGADGITQILGWLMWGLVGLCLVGMMIAGGLMAIGHTSERPYMAARAKSGFMWSLIGAAVIAAARLIVGAAFNIGVGA